MIKKVYVYESNSFDPYLNIATEKYLLDTLPTDSLVLYLWQNDNTVVIGRNQNPWAECECRLLEAEGGHLARRLSGGGAVFHDKNNLNFTFITETENYELIKNLEVIRAACKLGEIETEISGRNDILVNSRKFSGNAFFTSKGKTVHHGTILIDTDRAKMLRYLTPSKAKLESKGVKSVSSRVINLKEINPSLNIGLMKNYMKIAITDVFKIPYDELKISDLDSISLLRKEFSSTNWIYGATLPFTVSFDGRFEWGCIEIRLDIKKGRIETVQTFTDSLDNTLSEKINSALSFCSFDTNSISKRLYDAIDSPISQDIITLIKNYGI